MGSFITCGEVELVRQVHTLVVRSAQVKIVFELQVQEEVEGVRQELREVEGDSKVEESRSLHEHVNDMDDKHKTHELTHGACAENEKKLDNARSCSVIVEVSEDGHWCTHRAASPRNHGCRHCCPHYAMLPRNHVQF